MKGLLLISGGFDSCVAGYLMKKQGLELEAVHFSYEPFTNNGPEIKSKEGCKILGISNIKVINIGNECKNIAEKCLRPLYYVLTKRLIMKKAEETALQNKCDFLITGEALAQVGSQTLSNLKTIDASVKITILRPLIGFDKEEIIKLAKEIRTYDISIGPEVCDVLGPKHPSTASSIEDVEKEEAKL